jgi:hypothetical protein
MRSSTTVISACLPSTQPSCCIDEPALDTDWTTTSSAALWRLMQGQPASQPPSRLPCITGPMVRTWFCDACLLTAEAPSAVRMCHKVLCAHAVCLLVIGCNSALRTWPAGSRRQPVCHVADTVAVTGAVLGPPGLSEGFKVEALACRDVCEMEKKQPRRQQPSQQQPWPSLSKPDAKDYGSITGKTSMGLCTASSTAAQI